MKIAINAGHTLRGKGTGAIGYLNETKENRKIALEVIKQLKQLGHEVVDCTIDESENDLKDAVIKANNSNVDIFCSIHLNAGGGKGTETYIYKHNSIVEKFAKRVNSLVSDSCDFANRGVKQANFYVLKYTKAPAVLLEVCFVDSKEDENKLNVLLVANAIVEGIVFEEKIEIYRVRKSWSDEKSQLGAYKVLENAIDVVKQNKDYLVFNSNGDIVFKYE